MTALLVIAILILLIVVHEFGHFLAAKLFRVRVDEFGIGFPPRAYLLGKWGGTEYSINWIPAGGFVKIFGEEEEDGVHGKGSFIDASRIRQAVILAAGVTANLIAAWALFFGAYTIGILHTIDNPAGQEGRLLVTSVVPGSPADIAGLATGDRVVRISDASGTTSDLVPDAVSAFISTRGGTDITLEYERKGEASSVVVRPAHAVVPDAADRPAVGVALSFMSAEPMPVQDAAYAASISTYNTVRLSVEGLVELGRGALSGAPDISSVAGPVGIIGAVSESSRDGAGYLLALAAFISGNLAVINLIPIPALDGGKLLFLGIEGVTRRAVPALLMRFLNTLGIALIMLLMVAVTYQDILRLIQ